MIHYYCIHCGEELVSAPEKEEGYWFVRCLACGAHNVLAQPPLPSLDPDEPAPADEPFIGYIEPKS